MSSLFFFKYSVKYLFAIKKNMKKKYKKKWQLIDDVNK